MSELFGNDASSQVSQEEITIKLPWVHTVKSQFNWLLEFYILATFKGHIRMDTDMTVRIHGYFDGETRLQMTD